ncbi:Type 1 glutamine amidotransferase-like domain-containing protein [Orbaceae bacterium ESL0727]|nr:Type 1 glutamine amidotransferase-like domain-containing protein [Orbaceae bacterium ESL0727]
MQKIFLTSYFAGTVNQFKTFIKNNMITANEVLFISTAGNVEDYVGYIDEGRQALIDLGYKVDELDIATTCAAESYRKIADAQILFIAGGNTFYLLQELQREKLVSLLVDKINSGTPYIGESAGAMILAPRLEYSKMMDDVSAAPDLDDYAGLAVTNFYTLPHYREYPFAESVQQIMQVYQESIHLVPINNSEAILTNGLDYKVMK